MLRLIGSVIQYFRRKYHRNTGVFGKIVAYFEKEHRGYYIIDDERRLVRMYLQGDSQIYEVVCATGELDSASITISRLLKVPGEKILPACVLANLVNMKTLAKFTIDDDGDLMVTMSLSEKICKITSRALRTAYLRSFKEAVTYYPAFHQLVSSEIIPEEAYCFTGADEEGAGWGTRAPYTRVAPSEVG